jgi:hypothetical protein
MPSPLLRPLLPGVAALSLAAACFLPHKKAGPSQAAPPVPHTEFALRVTNHNYLDVVIYVLHHGQHTRVGTVTGSSSELFLLPARLLVQGGGIQLYGDPIGSDDYAITETLIVEPGEYVEWTLETDLKRSSVAVF